MPFCDVSEVVPKALMAVIPEKYKGMKYHKVTVGEILTLYGVTVVSYQAKDKESGDLLERKDGTPVLNQNCYFDLGDGVYTSIKNEKVLGQVANLTGWFEQGIGEIEYKFDKPEKVQIIETPAKMGKKEYPVPAFKSIQ